jgi:outer membrane protein
MKTVLRSAAIGAALLATPALAADLSAPRTAIDGVVAAPSFNPWMIRLRGLVVMPSAGGAVTNPALGSTLNISTSVVPELDITYFITRNIALELILGVTPHRISARGPLAAALGSTAKIADTWLLPPTLMLQYHVTEFGAFKPYVGVGLNYTFFFSNKPAGAVAALGYDRFSINSNVGFALQAGFDYMIDRHWGVNVDVKKIFLRSNFRYSDSTGVAAPITGRATIDPWLISAGITYKF